MVLGSTKEVTRMQCSKPQGTVLVCNSVKQMVRKQVIYSVATAGDMILINSMSNYTDRFSPWFLCYKLMWKENSTFPKLQNSLPNEKFWMLLN